MRGKAIHQQSAAKNFTYILIIMMVIIMIKSDRI